MHGLSHFSSRTAPGAAGTPTYAPLDVGHRAGPTPVRGSGARGGGAAPGALWGRGRGGITAGRARTGPARSAAPRPEPGGRGWIAPQVRSGGSSRAELSRAGPDWASRGEAAARPRRFLQAPPASTHRPGPCPLAGPAGPASVPGPTWRGLSGGGGSDRDRDRGLGRRQLSGLSGGDARRALSGSGPALLRAA